MSEIDATQEALLPQSVASGQGNLKTLRGGNLHASVDHGKDLSNMLSLSIGPSTTHARSPSVSLASGAAVNSASPQMVRKAISGSSSSAPPAKTLPVSAAKPTMAELRSVPEGVQNQLKALIGRLVQLTKQFESTESAQLSILELGGVLRCAFTCLDRGFCLDTLKYVLACMDAAGWSDWTVSLLSVIFGPGTNFIALNMPVTTYTIANSSDYMKQAETNHPLIALIVKRLRQVRRKKKKKKKKK